MQASKAFISKQNSQLKLLTLGLPKLPNTIRYYDDFDDVIRSIGEFRENDSFEVFNNGSKWKIDFSKLPSRLNQIAKGLFYYLVTSEFKIHTVYTYVVALNSIEENLLSELLLAGPTNIKAAWSKLVALHSENAGVFTSVKALLVFLASCNAAGWSSYYSEFISHTLPCPSVDKYAGVRSGDVFLSALEEASIVNSFEELSRQLEINPHQIDSQELEPICMLACAYLFGMRPLQIALLTMRDVRIWQDEGSANPTVHLTFRMVKQKTKSRALPLTRRIKREWAPMFIELYRRAQSHGKTGESKLFDIKSAHDVSSKIKELATTIVGADVSATDLRHTAAQRLVDAGASQEEVAEFMGHSSITTCLVYYATSPTQAERVNNALGISNIYQTVVKIAHDKFISPSELAKLKGDQQIAGVPHGIAITGIGGCSTGQPCCPYNPITSCYGCQKFMPVADLELHQKVLVDMRCIVLFFEKSSREDGNSPAFMQLKRTIAQIQAVINELEVFNA